MRLDRRPGSIEEARDADRPERAPVVALPARAADVEFDVVWNGTMGRAGPERLTS